MTLRLPPHIQKQLADMACSPPRRSPSDAPANSQYHAALAIQYRRRIQGIINADLSAFITADDVIQEEPVRETSPLPSKRHDSPSTEAQVEDVHILPPYSEEDPDVNTTACTITVKELSSIDTPTPSPTSVDNDNRFFALVATTTHETMPTRPHADSHFSTASTSSEDADADADAIQPAADHRNHRDSSFAPPKLLRAAALDTNKPRDRCKTKHSHPHSPPPPPPPPPTSCPRSSSSKVRRIVERFTAKKEDTAAKDKRHRSRQPVV